MTTLNIDPGAFRDELSLQECQTVYDATGGYAENWNETAKLFAKIEPARASSTFDADQTIETMTHEITTRWQPGVASGMRMIKDNRIFEIRTVYDPDESGRYLVCGAVEKGA